jgi:integrase
MGSVRRRGRHSFLLDYSGPRGRERPTVRADSKAEAEQLLKQREGDIAYGRRVVPDKHRIVTEDIGALLLQDYEINNRRSTGKARKTLEHLLKAFKGWPVVNITAPVVQGYIHQRQAAGYRNASINLELAALKRMFRLAAISKLLSSDDVPYIPMLKAAPPRSGFFEPDQFQAVLKHLPLDIRPVAMLGYEIGWRPREITELQWRHVNLDVGFVRLDPGTTKNGEGRLVYLSPTMLDALRAQAAATRDLERRRGIIIPWVFHRQGRHILRFLGSWRTACKKASVPGMLFHDLRRTAIRNMVRAGIPESVAMMISGHKTRSVFERYNIVSESDLREAARRLDAAQSRSNGHVADPRRLPDGRSHSS